jgi:hypothetical protein
MILDVFNQPDETSNLDDDGFGEFAIAYGFFENGERCWAVLWKLIKLRYRLVKHATIEGIYLRIKQSGQDNTRHAYICLGFHY